MLSKDDLRKIGFYTSKGQSDLHSLTPEELDDFSRLMFLRLIEDELAELGGLYGVEPDGLLADGEPGS